MNLKKGTTSNLSIIFIDEIDALGNRENMNMGNDSRTQTLNQLLTCMDGIVEHKNVLVIAATNNMENIDPALKRSGRFDKIVSLELPNEVQLTALAKYYFPIAQRSQDFTDEILVEFVDSMKGMNCADLKNIYESAKYSAMLELIKSSSKDRNGLVITVEHFKLAVEEMQARKAKEQIQHKSLFRLPKP